MSDGKEVIETYGTGKNSQSFNYFNLSANSLGQLNLSARG